MTMQDASFCLTSADCRPTLAGRKHAPLVVPPCIICLKTLSRLLVQDCTTRFQRRPVFVLRPWVCQLAARLFNIFISFLHFKHILRMYFQEIQLKQFNFMYTVEFVHPYLLAIFRQTSSVSQHNPRQGQVSVNNKPWLTLTRLPTRGAATETEFVASIHGWRNELYK
jgi:hypothetical protein